jgi:hypothetical protein
MLCYTQRKDMSEGKNGFRTADFKVKVGLEAIRFDKDD